MVLKSGASDADIFSSVEANVGRPITHAIENGISVIIPASALISTCRPDDAYGCGIWLALLERDESQPCVFLARIFWLQGLSDQALQWPKTASRRRARPVTYYGSGEGSPRQALDLACEQGVLSWELRAATSLVRLWYMPNRSAEASALLQPVYDRFTEGFETDDLKAAKTLLDTLP